MLCLGFGYNRDDALVVIAAVEIHRAVDECKECVVLANGNSVTGIVMCATLAHDDVSGLHLLSTPDFHSKSLGCALAAVLRTTYTFFMCHNSVPFPPSGDYLFNFNLCVLLAMTVLLA